MTDRYGEFADRARALADDIHQEYAYTSAQEVGLFPLYAETQLLGVAGMFQRAYDENQARQAAWREKRAAEVCANCGHEHRYDEQSASRDRRYFASCPRCECRGYFAVGDLR